MARKLAVVRRDVSGPPVVDVAIPVFNEERDLARSVRRLRRYLDDRFPFEARITIVDNASTDRTWDLARGLALELPGVRAQHLHEKGRGRAVRHAWLGSDAAIVAYMDVDLSTDLDALLPLVAPLISGHSDLAIGSRLARGARVVRGPKRELISRCYNLVLHVVLGTRVRDAQCGFKAIRADAARRLLPLVDDQAWFFDTELLVQAQRTGLRIYEVPVDWVEDPDTRVELVPTALEDLRGVWRLSGALRSFAAIGIASTLAYVACYVVLRLAFPATMANALSQLITTFGNTAANRRFTFGAEGNGAVVRDHVGGLTAFGVALGLTTAAIAGLHVVAPGASRLTELIVLVAANLLATAVRFVLLRAWITPAHPDTDTLLPFSRRTA
ncbi:MAG: bifunctional glycosyltransferase family 2/GtrA family protein [Candidatus Dormibacteraeota bacterium]|nr:bifunctional glycosyltransferase family 2/GtrA family protein [Candidatus Dormibacteraeota bacterium]